MTQFAYTSESTTAMIRNPQDWSVFLKKIVEQLGGRLIGLYYCFGEYDGVAITELPDQVTEFALLLTANAPGHLKATKTTVLFTMEEAVEAMKKAIMLDAWSEG